MAKRFQDTEECKTHFVRSLPGKYRAFWFWLKMACDHSGLWEIDIDEARMRTGFFDLEKEEAESLFSTKILPLECGEKWFLLNFCEEQYKTNQLNPYMNTAHRGVIFLLHKFRLIDNDFKILKEQFKGELKPLPSSFKTAQDKVKDMNYIEEPVKIDNSFENEKDQKLQKPKAKAVPKDQPKTFDTPLVKAFRDFKEMRVKKRAPLTPRAAELIHMELKKLAGDDELLKIAILEQSTLSSWSDVFPLKDKTKYNAIKAQGSKVENVINIATAATFQEQQEA